MQHKGRVSIFNLWKFILPSVSVLPLAEFYTTFHPPECSALADCKTCSVYICTVCTCSKVEAQNVIIILWLMHEGVNLLPFIFSYCTSSIKLFIFLPSHIHLPYVLYTFLLHLISLQVSSFTHKYYGRSVSLGKVILLRCKKIQVGGCCNIWDVTVLSSLSVM